MLPSHNDINDEKKLLSTKKNHYYDDKIRKGLVSKIELFFLDN